MNKAISRQAVTLKDIAARCDVHVMTVSRAMRDDPRIRKSTAKRIRDVAAELGYDPAAGHAARRLVSGGRGKPVLNQVVAAFFPPNFVRNPYFAHMFEGIMEVLCEANYTVHLIPTYQAEKPQSVLHDLPPALRRGELDGAIFTHWPYYAEDVLQQLRDTPGFGNRPVVAAMEVLPGCTSVLTDDYSGMYEVMTQLLKLGHRQFIHWYDFTGHYLYTERLRAMRDACTQHGLDPATHLCACHLDWHRPLGQRIERPLRQALQERPEATAVLVPNDYYAVQATACLETLQLNIPNDVSLVGFDDTWAVNDENHENILTTVRLPMAEVGRETARCLLREIKGESLDIPKLPTQAIIRGSIAKPRQVGEQ